MFTWLKVALKHVYYMFMSSLVLDWPGWSFALPDGGQISIARLKSLVQSMQDSQLFEEVHLAVVTSSNYGLVFRMPHETDPMEDHYIGEFQVVGNTLKYSEYYPSLGQMTPQFVLDKVSKVLVSSGFVEIMRPYMRHKSSKSPKTPTNTAIHGRTV